MKALGHAAGIVTGIGHGLGLFLQGLDLSGDDGLVRLGGSLVPFHQVGILPVHLLEPGGLLLAVNRGVGPQSERTEGLPAVLPVQVLGDGLALTKVEVSPS